MNRQQKTKSHSDPGITVDKERARLVLRSLRWVSVKRQKFFAHVSREADAPQQKFFPGGVAKGSVEHRRWLFFSAMTDRLQVSERVYESHARLWTREPWLYSEEVIGTPPEEIARILNGENVGSPAQSARYWPRSAETLFQGFGGDPLEIYRKFNTVNRILSFKEKGGNLPGFGPKILSLLSIFFSELGLMATPRDAFPVDRHVQRFALSTGIIVANASVTGDQMESRLRPLLCELCAEEGWDPLDLSHDLWLLGSRGCNGCYRDSAMRVLCPVYAECGGSVSTLSYTRSGVWNVTEPRHRKGGTLVFALPPSTPLFLFPLQSAD